jgi:hypothetical protein
MTKVQNFSNVNFKNIIYDDIAKSNNNRFLVSKMWHFDNKTKNIQTLNVQTQYVKIYKLIQSDDLLLIPDDDIFNFMENLDKLTYNYINDNNLVQKYNLQNYKYKTLIGELENPHMNILRLKIMKEKNPTLFFSSKTKNILNYTNAKNIFPKIDEVKIIIEIDGLIIDTEKKVLTTNIIARQILLKEKQPHKIILTEYSFNDSDEEKLNNNIDENDIILNTQSEYVSDKSDNDNTINYESNINSDNEHNIIHSHNFDNNTSNNEPDNKSNNESGNKSNNDSDNKSNNDSDDDSDNKSNNHSDNKSNNDSDNESDNDSDNKSNNHSDNKSNNDSDNESDNDSDNKSNNDSDNKSNNDSDNKSDNKSNNDLDKKSNNNLDNKSNNDSDNKSDNDSDDDSKYKSNNNINKLLQCIKPKKITPKNPSIKKDANKKIKKDEPIKKRRNVKKSGSS